MIRRVTFTVLGRPAPQGSMRSLGKFMKCDNPNTMPYRQAVGWSALDARTKAGIHDVFAARHVPVLLGLVFYFAPPQKMPKGRTLPAVKPDLDKLCRSVFDACKGILWVDDGQIVEMDRPRKLYGVPERTEITVALL
jgi:Holliday junction resolvase RusA-like endonuclease